MSRQTERLEFDNPELIRRVCGADHSHLALLEQAFDVYIEAPGNFIQIDGKLNNRDQTRAIIEKIYHRFEQGLICELEDIRMLITHVKDNETGDINPQTLITLPRRATIAPKTARQAAFIEALQTQTIIFGVGPAGTGKTFLATAYGASLLAKGEIARFIACRPAVEAGEQLGFLPGDMREKIDPYMQPIWDALNRILGRTEVERRCEAGDIEVAPLAFMRGRTLSDAFVVIDEAQNATIAQMKMLLTRLGQNAKYAITGDPSQSDLPPGQTSGLVHALTILDKIDHISQIGFSATDVVRHPLVSQIITAYEQNDIPSST